jgi:hypothetical protein
LEETCRQSLTNFITCVGFELTTLVVIGTDCTGSLKSNYHMITTMTAPTPPCDQPLYFGIDRWLVYAG